MLKQLTAASLLTCVAAVPAIAQTQATTPPETHKQLQTERNAQSNTSGQTSATSGQTAQAGGTVQFIRSLEGTQFRSSHLVGKSVYNLENEDIGEIGDLLLDREGQVAGVVIDVGGFLGIGQNEVAVSMDALRFEPENDTMAAGNNDAASGRSAAAENVTGTPAGNAMSQPDGANISADRQNSVTDGSDELNARIVLATTREDLEDAPKFDSEANASDQPAPSGTQPRQ